MKEIYKCRKNYSVDEGITLIALVVTIVVLLILAGITISLVFGSNGVIKKAQEANENTKIAQVREQLELAKGPEYIEGNGKYNPDSYFERIETEGIIGNKDTDVIDNGDGTYEVTTTSGYIFKITLVPSKDNVEDIQIEHIGKVDGPRIRNLTVSKTTNSITVEVETANAEGATYTYYYKKDGEVSWKKAEEIKEKTYTFSGLESNVIYNIKVRVEKDGKAVEKEVSTITGELPEGAVQFSPVEWNNGQASTIITTAETGYTLQYQVGGIAEDNWTDATSGTTIENLQHGTTVYGRLFDGTNGSKTASIDVEDKIAPNTPTIIISGTNGNNGYYKSNVTATITAGSDGQSGANQVRYSVSGAQIVNQTTTESGTTSASITISADGISTITAYTIDKAGKVSTAKTQVVYKDSTAPSTANLTVGTVEETSIVVTARGDDGTSGVYSYQFQISTTSDTTGFTTVATQRSSDASYEYTYTGLTGGITYYLRVVVTDMAGNTRTSTAVTQTTNYPIVENKLKVGDYVYYYDKNGTRRLCAVLYDNSSGYGVQIITMSAVENVELGNGAGNGEESNFNQTDFNTAMNSYNNAIETLNKRAEVYLNSTYAGDARCVGSVPNNKNSQSGYYTFTEFTSKYNGKFLDADLNYETDWNQMVSLGISYIGENYYLASRLVESQDFKEYVNFAIRITNGYRMVEFSFLLCKF